MKAKLLIGLGCLWLSTYSFASCGGQSGCAYYNKGCSAYATCSAPRCSTSCTSDYVTCDCADGGWYYNDCISKAEYCCAFGNIGRQ